MSKFLVKVFISVYLMNMLMDQVDTLPVSRYWSEVSCTLRPHYNAPHYNAVFNITRPCHGSQVEYFAICL